MLWGDRSGNGVSERALAPLSRVGAPAARRERGTRSCDGFRQIHRQDRRARPPAIRKSDGA
jgi:hypothetical protein